MPTSLRQKRSPDVDSEQIPGAQTCCCYVRRATTYVRRATGFVVGEPAAADNTK
jgi:hypothetical protein